MKAHSFGRSAVIFAVVVIGLLASAGIASAATLTVNTTTDSATDTCATSTSPCSLRGAVIAADNAGGTSTITVPAGTYTLTIPTSTTADDPTTGDLDINSGVSVTLTGAGPGSTIIDANQIDRAFDVVSGASLAISGVTIENGAANDTSGGSNDDEGGAIYSDGTLAVTDSVLDHDDAEEGGDIFVDSDATSTTVTGSLLENSIGSSEEFLEGAAGAMLVAGGSLTVTGSQFVDDSSSVGGGALLLNSGSGATYSISDSSFSDDTAGIGGAIYVDDGALTISRSTLTGNAAAGFYFDIDILLGPDAPDQAIDPYEGEEINYGGAIALAGGSATVTKSELTGNSAQTGGAIADGVVFFGLGSGTLQVDHSTLDHNTASTGVGGGLYLESADTALISDSTLSDNSATQGGGVYADDGNTAGQFTNDTIADNSAPTPDGCDASSCGGGIAIADEGGLAGVVNTIVADNTGGDCSTAIGSADQGYNLDSDGSCFPSGEATGDVSGQDPLLGPLQDNGGPAPTQMPAAGSPAINAGSNSACPSDDERGVARPYPAGGTCDIGAVEVAPATLSLSNQAPASASRNEPFTETITASNAGPSPSSQTTITTTLPKGETLVGTSDAQGSCTSSGSPVQVSCALGDIAAGSKASVTLVVSESDTGSVTDTASASNGEGSNVSAKASTDVSTASVTGKKPTAVTGAASKLSFTGAHLAGLVKTGSETTTYFFEYGTSTHLGQVSALEKTTTNRSVSATLSGLHLATTYHYRLVAVNGTGQAFGRERTFRTKGTAFNGDLILDSLRLKVRDDKVYVPFTCKSSKACHFRFSIDARAAIDQTGQSGPILITTSTNGLNTVGPHATRTIAAKVTGETESLIRESRDGELPAKLTSRPRSGQRGLIKLVTLVLGS